MPVSWCQRRARRGACFRPGVWPRRTSIVPILWNFDMAPKLILPWLREGVCHPCARWRTSLQMGSDCSSYPASHHVRQVATFVSVEERGKKRGPGDAAVLTVKSCICCKGPLAFRKRPRRNVGTRVVTVACCVFVISVPSYLRTNKMRGIGFSRADSESRSKLRCCPLPTAGS